MERKKIKLSNQKTILVAPLDWGLGHATRCIPLIDILLKKNHRVIIAGNGDSFFLLKEQYPALTFYELPAYNIKYEAGKNASVQGLLQTPKILKTINAENKVIAEIAEKDSIDLIVSDNRYGVRHDKIKSIFICHQIALQVPAPFQFMNPVFLKLHLNQIHKFDALWVPDEENSTNLSGKLSHNIHFKIPHSYIGIQSRFSNYTSPLSTLLKEKRCLIFDGTGVKFDDLGFNILIVLSGVEPQRTFLEKELIKQFKSRNEKVLLVQGKTEKYSLSEENNITVVSYFNTNDLFAALQKAKIIICRSGYSTVMDLAVLGKKAILIPAEGQTEQEYLAKTLSQKGFAVECKQDNLDIETALEKLKTMDGFTSYKTSTEKLETELNKYLT